MSTPVELRIGFIQQIDSLNPMAGLTGASYFLYSLVYDNLQAVTEDLEPGPNLATSYRPVNTSDPDLASLGTPYGSVWEYELTRNAFWTDGMPFTSDDVVFTLNLAANNFEYMWAFQPSSYFIREAKKVDNYTVRIYFWDSNTGFPIPAAIGDLLAIPILPKHKLESMTPSEIALEWDGVIEGEESPIVGTGPFMSMPRIRQDWLEGHDITLVRNPDYHWKADRGKEIQFDKIVMHFFESSTAMVYALENGELDIASFSPQAYGYIKADVAAGKTKNIVTFDGLKPTQYWVEVGVNMNRAGPNPSRLDPAVRHALAMATNKSYIVGQYYLGLAEEGSTLISPVSPFWHYEPTKDEEFSYDLSAANNLLESAGYARPAAAATRVATISSRAVQEGLVLEGTPLRFDILVRREHPEEKDIAQYLEEQWAKIGIDIDLVVLDEVALSEWVYSYDYDLMIWYWSGDPDPNFLLFSQSKLAWNGWNDNMYGNQYYEENYTKSVSAIDRNERKMYVENCQRINYLDAGYIILAYPYDTYAWRNDTFDGWGNWSENPGRSIDAYWSGNPLYFDLRPLGTKDQTEVSVVSIVAGIGLFAVAVSIAILLRRRKKDE